MVSQEDTVKEKECGPVSEIKNKKTFASGMACDVYLLVAVCVLFFDGHDPYSVAY